MTRKYTLVTSLQDCPAWQYAAIGQAMAENVLAGSSLEAVWARVNESIQYLNCGLTDKASITLENLKVTWWQAAQGGNLDATIVAVATKEIQGQPTTLSDVLSENRDALTNRLLSTNVSRKTILKAADTLKKNYLRPTLENSAA